MTFTKVMVGKHTSLPDGYYAGLAILLDALDNFEFNREVLSNDETTFLKDVIVSICNLNEAYIDAMPISMRIDELFRTNLLHC